MMFPQVGGSALDSLDRLAQERGARDRRSSARWEPAPGRTRPAPARHPSRPAQTPRSTPLAGLAPLGVRPALPPASPAPAAPGSAPEPGRHPLGQLAAGQLARQAPGLGGAGP